MLVLQFVQPFVFVVRIQKMVEQKCTPSEQRAHRFHRKCVCDCYVGKFTICHSHWWEWEIRIRRNHAEPMLCCDVRLWPSAAALHLLHYAWENFRTQRKITALNALRTRSYIILILLLELLAFAVICIHGWMRTCTVHTARTWGRGRNHSFTLVCFSFPALVSWAHIRLWKNEWINCAEIMSGICNEPSLELFARRSWFPT